MRDSFLHAALAIVRRRLRNRFYLSYGMRGTAPINPAFGSAEGTPIDRHYVDRFLGSRCEHITGRVLEVGDSTYTGRFGQGVTRSDVLHTSASPDATIVGDLTSCPQIPSGSFDCVILTQVLHCIYDMEAVIAEARRILGDGGTLLCTVPGISQISRFDMDRWGDRWRLTTQSASELLLTAFDPNEIDIVTYGNAYSSVCFLQGVPYERLNKRRVELWEPDYQLIIGMCAEKSGEADGASLDCGGNAEPSDAEIPDLRSEGLTPQ
ncbi:MAG: methyltransferase domain-containing protein [Actinomycetota bacterium]|nr:methyltransferase domain-containing protein [Actinomycetota bacterium]